MSAAWHSCLVDRLSGNTKWIQRGTALKDSYNTRTDRSAASLPAAGQTLPGQAFRDFSLLLHVKVN